MPLYFFHLCFADRTVPDDEGVELPDRSAARAEALAVIQDLSNPEVAGNPRRWASWFLQVADEGGEFLRMPIGHPALEVVTPAGRQPEAERSEAEPARPARTVATPAACFRLPGVLRRRTKSKFTASQPSRRLPLIPIWSCCRAGNRMLVRIRLLELFLRSVIDPSARYAERRGRSVRAIIA